ncbi:MAG: VTT domain-containing protein [Planctomycetota bacterium]|nr:VTT domain-containing protein [Planctomycetota bacterium]
MTSKHKLAILQPHLPDDVKVRHWFMFYGLLLVAAAVGLWLLISQQPWSWSDWRYETAGTFAATSPAIKLLGFAVYLSLCCTFLPMPTGWIVAGVATQQAAVGTNFWTTMLMVAAAGAAGSTIANLNDYHLFTWILRNRRIAKVRQTKTYNAAARWFARAPFLLLVIFNVIPIPVDVIRMLATTYRYPRVPFAAGNFIGRFIRYGVIAFVTYFWNLGWIAVVALLALAVVLAGGRGLGVILRKILTKNSCNAGQQADAPT